MIRIFKNSIVVVVLTAMSWAGSQPFTPPVNKNAALRYWLAFAELQNSPADEGTTHAMDQVLAGSADWDEQRLGSVVDANAAAVQIMQRASSLPECNWGLDYSQGSSMSIAHLPKARVLARLNALYGARQMAKGDATGAVDTWLAGLRFAQCVAKDMSMIGILSAKPAFMANLQFLTRAARSGSLNSALQEKIRVELRRLPADGLDWPAAIRVEAWADAEGLRSLAKAPNFAETYKKFYSHELAQPAHPPTDAEIAEFQAFMNEIVAAFQLPPAETGQKLKTIMAKTEKMNPAVADSIPNYVRFNDNREQVSNEEQNLLAALGGRK